MFWFGESELAEIIESFRTRSVNYAFWWYRDVMLQAKERGLLKIIADSEDNPFFCRKFDESIEMSDKLKELIERNKQRDLR